MGWHPPAMGRAIIAAVCKPRASAARKLSFLLQMVSLKHAFCPSFCLRRLNAVALLLCIAV